MVGREMNKSANEQKNGTLKHNNMFEFGYKDMAKICKVQILTYGFNLTKIILREINENQRFIERNRKM